MLAARWACCHGFVTWHATWNVSHRFISHIHLIKHRQKTFGKRRPFHIHRTVCVRRHQSRTLARQLLLIIELLITVALRSAHRLPSQQQLSLLWQIPDPHGAAALHHQAEPAQLSAFTLGHSAREAPRGRLCHAPGRQVAPGFLQVRGPPSAG